MVMNITIDDTAGVLSYSSGWRIQPSGDPSFFQNTYHAAESTGQTVSVTFNGTAVYIYGSKGTTYGDFKVQVDDLVTFHSSSLPGSSKPAVQYQQILFADTFDSGTHLVQLSTTSNNWVDFDYMVLTSDGPDESNPNPGSFSSTISALNPSKTNSPISSSTQPAGSTSTSSTSLSSSPFASTSSPSASASHSSTNTVTAALAGVFGGLLGLVLLSLLIYRLLKRHQRRQYEREREFRRGPLPYISTPTNATSGNANTEKRGLFSGLVSSNSAGGGGERSGTPYSGVSGASASMNTGGGLRPSHASGASPYGTAGAYAFTRVGNGQVYGGAPDPRQSIDFLSVRS